MACGGTKDATTSKNKAKDGLLSYGDDVRQRSSYENIKGTVPRLKAMLCGQFVHYNRDEGAAEGEYTPWLVNGGKDSVMLYRLPVGDANKDGHWMYHYQYLTSLPDDPIYTAFSKLETIDRDSIQEVFYEVPANFDVSLAKIVANPTGAFKDFDFKLLKPEPSGEVITYERENLLKYKGVSSLRPTESTDENRVNGYDGEYYEVTPELYIFSRVGYTPNRELIGNAEEERMVKIAKIKSSYIEQ